jgi:hypothetical protein
MNEQEKLERQKKMFGCLSADLDAFLVKHIGAGKSFLTVKDAVMSILSDAQEEQSRNNSEAANQAINRAKYLLFKGV